MIYSLNGKLIYTEIGMAVIECSGVGYAVKTSLSTLAKLPAIGENVFLFTYMAVREDNVSLFGFYDKEELHCFKMLTSISGVGPKVGIAILSELNPQKFALCIASSDVKSLTKCPGIGAKIASRIVLELKDKIMKEQNILNNDSFTIPQLDNNTSISEAINALVVLGYSQSEAMSCLSKVDQTLPVEELIRYGLKALATKL